MIKTIKICNFKSFDETEVNLGRFNVLIGANAAGKSNFVSVFRFIKDIIENGLEDAVSMQGGTGYIRNVNLGNAKNLSLELSGDFTDNPSTDTFFTRKEDDEEHFALVPTSFVYKFSIQFAQRGLGYKVVEEILRSNFDFEKGKDEGGKIRRIGKIGEGEIILKTDEHGRVIYEFNKAGEVPLETEDIIFPALVEKGKLSPKELFIGKMEYLFPHSLLIRRFLGSISIYDFDPRLSKTATSISGKTELEPDGSNLAIVLRNILAQKKKREKLYKLIKDFLPFIEDIMVEERSDTSVLAKLKEVYSGDFLPAFIISDGTINITALIIALYFEEKPLIVFEEPERNVHPYLISKIINQMKDASERLKKQIIMTTHNPEVVKYTDMKDILLLQRDKKGFSQISRPAEVKQVQIFLQNNMGIDKLFAQRLLEW